jgi:hypothetical protein
MKGPSGKDLGDIDTLFISEDSNSVVLLERKRSTSANKSSLKDLLSQIRQTRIAFNSPETTFSSHFRHNATNATTISVAYCKSGPEIALQELNGAGVHVITSAVEHMPP